MDYGRQFPGVTETILVVDDNEINRALLNAIFSDSYRIEEAENGKEAMDLLLDHGEEISAVLLDVIMPVMDGIEVLEKLNQLGWTRKIPVFLITAESANSTVKKAYSLGVMDVISKPVVPYIVERRINSVIELFRARKRLSNQVEDQQSEILRQAQEIIKLNQGMIEALSTAIEFRSGESGEHVRRIHDITEYMLLHTDLGAGLSKETISHIALAAIMHDVGKIAIPDAILNKPGRLTADEFEIMKTHTVQGGLLLEKIPQMKEHAIFEYAYDIARHHHERWDGKGYPRGLKGEEIPRVGRLMALADVYDALISKRVYKPAFDHETARNIIVEGRGTQFDPLVVEAFLFEEDAFRSLIVTYPDDENPLLVSND